MLLNPAFLAFLTLGSGLETGEHNLANTYNGLSTALLSGDSVLAVRRFVITLFAILKYRGFIEISPSVQPVEVTAIAPARNRLISNFFSNFQNNYNRILSILKYKKCYLKLNGAIYGP